MHLLVPKPSSKLCDVHTVRSTTPVCLMRMYTNIYPLGFTPIIGRNESSSFTSMAHFLDGWHHCSLVHLTPMIRLVPRELGGSWVYGCVLEYSPAGLCAHWLWVESNSFRSSVPHFLSPACALLSVNLTCVIPKESMMCCIPPNWSSWSIFPSNIDHYYYCEQDYKSIRAYTTHR